VTRDENNRVLLTTEAARRPSGREAR